MKYPYHIRAIKEWWGKREKSWENVNDCLVWGAGIVAFLCLAAFVIGKI